MDFLNEHEIPIGEVNKLPKDKFEPFKEIYTQHIGSPILEQLRESAEEFKLDSEVFRMVYEGVFAIALKHPVSNEAPLNKLDNASSRVKL